MTSHGRCALNLPFRLFSNWQTISRPVALGQREGVFDDDDFAVVLGDDDFDDVEAVADVGEVEHAEPGDGATGDEVLFFAVNGFRGVAEFAGLPGFHLGEDKFIGVEVTANKIDFAAAGGAKVSVEDLEAGTLKVFRREVLALPA
jgi:hypothetical protein